MFDLFSDEMIELCGVTVDMATEDIYAAYVSFEGYFIPNNCTLVFQSGIWNESGWDSISIFFTGKQYML